MPWSYRETLYPTPSPSAGVEPASGDLYRSPRRPVVGKSCEQDDADPTLTRLWTSNTRRDQVSPLPEFRAGT